MKFTAPLRYLLILVLIGLQVLTLTGVLISSASHSSRVIREHAREVMDHLLKSAADNSHTFLSPAERSAQVAASLLGSGLLSTDVAMLESYFRQQLLVSQELAGMYLGRPDGSFVFVKREGETFVTKVITTVPERIVVNYTRSATGELLQRSRDFQDTFDPRERPWYQSANTKGRQVWTEPYVFFSSQKPGITTALPVFNQNVLVGVVGVDIEISGLAAFLEQVPLSQNGAAFIMNADGVAVALPQLEAKLINGLLPKLTEVGEDVVSGLLEAQGLHTANSLVEYSAGGQDYYGLITAFSVAPETTWYVGVHAPTNDFLAEIQSQNQRHLLQVLVIGLLTCLLAIPLVFGLTRPVQDLYIQATRDQLTKLANRSDFLKRAEVLVKHKARMNQPVFAVMVDLDGFKEINDTFGHQAGDEVLSVIGKRLSHSVREGDLVGRLGGDEFGLLLCGVTTQQAELLVDRLRQDIGRVIVSSFGELQVTASIGLMEVQGDFNLALAQADQALLNAKSAGKNRFEVASN